MADNDLALLKVFAFSHMTPEAKEHHWSKGINLRWWRFRHLETHHVFSKHVYYREHVADCSDSKDGLDSVL